MVYDIIYGDDMTWCMTLIMAIGWHGVCHYLWRWRGMAWYKTLFMVIAWRGWGVVHDIIYGDGMTWCMVYDIIYGDCMAWLGRGV